jgi:predicted nucleic acid-binding protein
MIVADTGAVLSLLDADDRHHQVLRALFEQRPAGWLLPWAILPEVDYLARMQLGARVAETLRGDLAAGTFVIEWGTHADLDRAHELNRRYRALDLGLVDGVVMAIAERRRAEAIATLDLRHFGSVRLQGNPKLVPRDL